eukprot:5036836-Pyramimonas_sp.AAC.1
MGSWAHSSTTTPAVPPRRMPVDGPRKDRRGGQSGVGCSSPRPQATLDTQHGRPRYRNWEQ